MTADSVRHTEIHSQSLSDDLGIVYFMQSIEQDNELVAPQTCRQVTFRLTRSRSRVDGAQICAKPIRNALEQLVAHIVTETIVDGLEPIEIEEQYSELVILYTPGAMNRLVEALLEHGTVR